jgi:FkbM family methyltransferase
VGPRTLYLLAVDDYETADLALMSHLLTPEDRFMVLGGGIGIAAALGARLTGREVVVVEANEALHGTILRQVEINGGRAAIEGGAVVADAEAYAGGTVAFAVAQEFWYSRIGSGAGSGARTVQVPVASFQDLCSRHLPSAVLIDIEGAEVSVLARPVPETVRTIIVEIHTPEIGAPMTGALITGLVNQGFRVADQQGLTWAFIR